MKSIEEILSEIRPELDFATSEDFIGDGMLDSFDLVMLVSELERTYTISIEGVDILSENFESIAAIRNLLTKCGACL